VEVNVYMCEIHILRNNTKKGMLKRKAGNKEYTIEINLKVVYGMFIQKHRLYFLIEQKW
jgi:hypothetical protein